VYLPDRDDEQVVIDKPLTFFGMVVTNEQFKSLDLDPSNPYSDKEISSITGGKVKLELIPRGVGRIEVRVPNLYHEIVAGEQVSMDITVRNDGTRRLDNIKITTDNPLHWKTEMNPDLIRTLAPEEEQIVTLKIIPPDDVGVGAQEVKIRTQAMADNRRVETEDKTLRIQVEAKTPVLWTIFLVLLLIGLVVGIVVFGVKISKR